MTSKNIRFGLAMLAVFTVSGCAQSSRFSFDATADARNFTPPEYPGPQYFLGVCQAIKKVGPGAFMVSPGDMEPPDRVRTTLDTVFGQDYAWYDALGNHELENPEYVSYLRDYNRNGTTLPRIIRPGPPGAVETCYSFDHGNAHFVVTNQYFDGASDTAPGGGTVSDALYDWVADDLSRTRKPYIFVVGHEPAYPMPDMDNGRLRHVEKSLDKHPDKRDRFWSLLARQNVTAFLCGHSHNASISKINGVWQVDVGHARGAGDDGAPSTFVKFHVEPDGVRCEYYRANPKGEDYRLTHTQQLAGEPRGSRGKSPITFGVNVSPVGGSQLPPRSR